MVPDNIKFLLFVLSVLVLVLSSSAQREKRFFRKDYTYLNEVSAFYKFHTIGKPWLEAKKICELEGATFYYPEDDAEQEMISEFWTKTQPNIPWIWIGVSDLIINGAYQTVDGIPIEEVYHDWQPSQPDNAGANEHCVHIRQEGTLNDFICMDSSRFICKKTLLSLEWNNECNTPDIEYIYREELGKCYKFHNNPQTWKDAAIICHREESYLAIINGDVEDKYLVNVTANADKRRITGNDSEFVWLGFQNNESEDWITVKGSSFGDSGFSRWGNGQPSGDSKEKCGSMSYSGDLYSLQCSRKHFFICERDVNSFEDFEVDK